VAPSNGAATHFGEVDRGPLAEFASYHAIRSGSDGVILVARKTSELNCQRFDIDGVREWERRDVLPLGGVGSFAVSDGAQGMIFVWAPNLQYGGVYAVRVDRNGNTPAGWNWNGNILATRTSNAAVKGAADPLGGVIVGFNEYSSGLSFSQRITSAGTIAPGWPAEGVLLTNAQYFDAPFTLLPDPSGGAIVPYTWNGDLHAHHVMSSGSLDPGWGPSGTPLSTAPDQQGFPSACPDGKGGAFVAWTSAGGYDIYATRILPEMVTGVPGRIDVPVTGILSVAPNPSAGQMSIEFAVERGGPVEIWVADVQGRVVARLADGDFLAGKHRVSWDGRTHAGRADPGVYFISCRQRGNTETRRIALID
jgi:hypothetical protein